MRFFKLYGLICLAIITFSCGGSDEKKEEKGAIKIGTKKEKKTKKISSNQGIGPIKDFAFAETIDKDLVAKGDAIFKAKCTACHMPTTKLIGPPVKDIYKRRNPTWVMNLLLNPDEMLNEDPDAKALLASFNNVRMLNQNLAKDEAIALSEYMRSL